VIYVYTATGGHLDDLPVEDARRFVEELATFLDTRYADIPRTIRETGALSEETEKSLQDAIAEFRQTFQPTAPPAGSEIAAGQGTAPDEVKPDVGWDRMSSAEDDTELERGEVSPGTDETQRLS